MKMGQLKLSTLLSLNASTLTDPDFLELLDNFESNSEAVFTDRRFHTFLVHHAVRDYETDSYSKEIIERCLAYGPDKKFILLLLTTVVNHNRKELFDEIVGQHEGSRFEQRDFFSISSNLASAIVSSGNYHFAKKLMCKGVYPTSASYFASSVCSFGRVERIQEAIDFLDFLILRRQEVDVNALVCSPAHGLISRPFSLLFVLITGQAPKEFKEQVGKYLISIGADVNYENELGQNILEMAREKGINLL